MIQGPGGNSHLCLKRQSSGQGLGTQVVIKMHVIFSQSSSGSRMRGREREREEARSICVSNHPSYPLFLGERQYPNPDHASVVCIPESSSLTEHLGISQRGPAFSCLQVSGPALCCPGRLFQPALHLAKACSSFKSQLSQSSSGKCFLTLNLDRATVLPELTWHLAQSEGSINITALQMHLTGE